VRTYTHPTADFACVSWYVVFAIFVDSFFNHSTECLTLLTLACHKFIMLAPFSRLSWCSATLNAPPFPYSMGTNSNAINALMFHTSMRAPFLRFPSGGSTLNTSPFPDSVFAYPKAFNTSAFLASVHAKRGLFLFHNRVANTDFTAAFYQIMWTFFDNVPLNWMSQTFSATCFCLLAMWTFCPCDFIYNERGKYTGCTHVWQTSGSIMGGLFEYLIDDYMISDTNFTRFQRGHGHPLMSMRGSSSVNRGGSFILLLQCYFCLKIECDKVPFTFV